MAQFGPGGRRTYDSIQKSGDLAPPQPQGVRRYAGMDKEKEKERFAHRMATGKDPPTPDLQIKKMALKAAEFGGGDFDVPTESKVQDLRMLECKFAY